MVETRVHLGGWASLRRPAWTRPDLLPYAFIAPILILLAAVSFYPAAYAVWLALTDASLLRLAKAEFVGFRNFYRLFDDPVFLNGIWRTLRWDLVVVFGELAISIPMALFLNLNFRGRAFLRAAILIPYIIPPAVTALMWVYMFDGTFGVVNDLLHRAGLIEHYVSWLSEPTASFGVIAAAMIWSGTPLMAVVLLAVLQTIPKDLYEAATIDGSSAWQQFRFVTLPQLMPTILFLLLLRMIWMSNHIDMIFIMTRGGPGFANYTEAVYSFQLTGQFDIGYASTVAVVLALVLIAASVAYVRHLARSVLT